MSPWMILTSAMPRWTGRNVALHLLRVDFGLLVVGGNIHFGCIGGRDHHELIDERLIHVIHSVRLNVRSDGNPLA